VLVLDETARYGRAPSIVSTSGDDGRYRINVGWTRTAGDPGDRDRVAGGHGPARGGG
jgi:hypothetical protein